MFAEGVGEVGEGDEEEEDVVGQFRVSGRVLRGRRRGTGGEGGEEEGESGLEEGDAAVVLS